MYRNDFWGQTRIAIRAYPLRKKKDSLSEREALEVRAVEDALEAVKALPGGDAIYRMLYTYHVQQTHTLDGAALQVGYSHGAAVRYNRLFTKYVAQGLGYLPPLQKSKIF